jgi:hypothetical protein
MGEGARLMLRSYHDENQEEFDLIREPDHIEAVTKKLKIGFAGYFECLKSEAPISDLARQLSGRFRVRGKPPDPADHLKTFFNGAVEQFEKDRSPYVKLFQPGHMESYRENPSTFRSRLVSKCPVIYKTLHSEREELHEWKRRFGTASSQELADIFANLIDFESSFADSVDRRAYAKFNSLDEFTFSEIEEKEYSVEGVIGMGIKSAVVYHLEPALFPRRGRFDLYALYFLAGKEETFQLPTKTSEFLMVNDNLEVTDKNLKMEHNFWYPYELFSLYEIRLFRWLKTECEKHGVALDPAYRYVYVAGFNDHICDIEKEAVKVMMGGGQTDGTNFYV